jgi:hypothetical protein
LADWKFGTSFESKDNEALIKEIRQMRDIKLAHQNNPGLFNARERNLFNKHGRTILPHDALPLDLRKVVSPGQD